MKRLTVASALVALTLVTGCGRGDDADDEPQGPDDSVQTDGTDETGTPEDQDPAADGDCALLPTAAVNDLVGEEATVAAATEAGCSFESESGAAITVTATGIAIDPASYAEQSRETCDNGDVVEVDAGDESFACLVNDSPMGWYFDVDAPAVITVTPSLFSDVDFTVDDMAKLAEQVTP